MGAEKHYAGRWICQKPIEKCNGFFNIVGYGERIPCPLADRCLKSGHRIGQLEYLHQFTRYGRLQIQSNPQWNRDHLKRRAAAEIAFDREGYNAKMREYQNRPEIKERRKEAFRTKWNPALQDLIPGYVPRGVKEELPPCGGDCRNGPYPECPDKCRYEGWVGPREKKRKLNRRYNKKKYEKHKARMENDPAYREAFKKREAERRHRDWLRKKEIMRQQKEGGANHGE